MSLGTADDRLVDALDPPRSSLARTLMAASLALGLLAASCGGGSSTGAGSPSPAGSTGTTERATLTLMRTATDVQAKGATVYSAGTTGQSLGVGDAVRTDSGARPRSTTRTDP